MTSPSSNGNVVGCPPLVSSEIDDGLVVSTSSSAVGTTVEFLCADANESLSGSKILHCTPAGAWNGTVPRCLNDTEISALPTTGSGVPPIPTAGPAETEVETVLIILWVSGGVLLISLVVLLTCIVRSHKKGRNNSSQSAQTRSPGQPRHGGVNPTFTNYDEIWTWIPVVTNSSDNCRTQINPIVRSSGANQRNTQLLNNLNNLRLPSYNEAINNRPDNGRSQTTRTPVASCMTSHQLSHGNARTRTSSNQQQSSNATSSYVVTASNRLSNHVTSPGDVSHYETIPADTSTTVSPSSCHVTYSSNHVTNVAVSALSGSPMQQIASGSALQEARALVNQSFTQSNRPLPSAPNFQRSASSPSRRTTQRENESRIVDQTSSRAMVIRAASISVPTSTESRTSYAHQSVPVVVSSSVFDARSQSQSPLYSSQIRQTSHMLYPVYNAHAHQPSSTDFRHSDGSAFTYVYDNGGRTRATVLPVGEAPPPYSRLGSASRDRTRESSSALTAAAVSTSYLSADYNVPSIHTEYF